PPAGAEGGAVRLGGGATCRFENNTVTATASGNVSGLVIQNCETSSIVNNALWNNGTFDLALIVPSNGVYTVFNNRAEGIYVDGAASNVQQQATISTDPLFQPSATPYVPTVAS